MGINKKLVGVALAVVASMALAQSPYVISGLHTDMVFTAAVAQAEKLGGNCQITGSGAQGGPISAQCAYATCSARNAAGACEQQGAGATSLTIAGQPIVQIGLEASGESAQLTRIGFAYEGSREAIAESLKKEFGSPSMETHSDKPSWSHSRQRLIWTHGIYHIGLLDAPRVIILGANRLQE